MLLARNDTVAVGVAASVGTTLGEFVDVEGAVADITAIVANVELALVDSKVIVDVGSKVAVRARVGDIVFIEICVGHWVVVKAAGLAIEDMVSVGERVTRSSVARVKRVTMS